jgi:hypothetical protein
MGDKHYTLCKREPIRMLMALGMASDIVPIMLVENGTQPSAPPRCL